MRLICLLFLLLVVPLLSSQAQQEVLPYTLPASIPEATIAMGQVPPGSKVMQDGRNLVVPENGLFLLAVPQMTKGSSKLVITLPDGKKHTALIPVTPRTWSVQKISGLPGSMVSPPASVLQRINSDNARIGRARRVLTLQPWWQGGFIKPAEGRISGVFGDRRILNGQEKQPHRGLDIAGSAGAPIIAPASGTITLVHEDMYYTGKTIMIDHGNALSSIMIHMSKIAVQEGQFVDQGAYLGDIGQTGRATGPHLHWGVFLGNVAVDPALVLQTLAAQPNQTASGAVSE